MPRQMYFKRAKIFLEQTDKGEQRFIASVGGPVQVPNWVCKTLGYKYGIKDGSIVDVTPPKHVAPIVDEEEPTVAFPGSAQEAAADETASSDIPDEEEAEDEDAPPEDAPPEDAPAEPPTKPAKPVKPPKQPPSRAGKGTVR